MPKKSKELSALEVGRLKDEGLHAIGGVAGLYMRIKGGAKAWILRVMVGSKRRDMGLGAFPAVTLAMAKDKAREARTLIEKGQDPILERQRARSTLIAAQASAMTFAEAARLFMDAKSGEWSNPKHRQQWANTLDAYAIPVLGKMLVSDVRNEHVLTILRPIWEIKTETASRLRGRIEQILDWATAQGYREGLNPARWRGHLDKILPRPSKIAKVEHHEAVSLDDLPGFVADLKGMAGTAARALEFLILTAARSGEVRGAQWSEFDLDAGVWTVPAERMKAKREHRVPLSVPALQILKAQPVQAGSAIVFPGSKGQVLSDMTLTAVMRRMKVEAVPHGFRSTFRDWAGERTDFPSDLAEMALAHTIPNKVEAAYRRGDMLAKRAAMMTAWADFALALCEAV